MKKNAFLIFIIVFFLSSCATKVVERTPNSFNSCADNFVKFHMLKDQVSLDKVKMNEKVLLVLNTNELKDVLKIYPKEEKEVKESVELILKKFPDFSPNQVARHYKLLQNYCGI